LGRKRIVVAKLRKLPAWVGNAGFIETMEKISVEFEDPWRELMRVAVIAVGAMVDSGAYDDLSEDEFTGMKRMITFYGLGDQEGAVP
jgi:hypothetical protein